LRDKVAKPGADVGSAKISLDIPEVFL
jgi:hypothetical protein